MNVMIDIKNTPSRTGSWRRGLTGGGDEIGQITYTAAELVRANVDTHF
jgi:hypothetical protein